MGQRLLAKLIDLGVYVGLSLGLFVIAVLGRLAGEAIGIGAVLGMVPYFLMCLVVFLFWPLYDSIMISRRGATIGMKSIGLRVINQADGRLLSGGAAFVRWLIPAVGTLIPIVGALLIYLSPLFDSSGRMQGWHDKAAGDLVIATR
ncbi:RDD family protein [Prescottella agglutinans]|nr:RDD family protein [Prescottella agglutinans]